MTLLLRTYIIHSYEQSPNLSSGICKCVCLLIRLIRERDRGRERERENHSYLAFNSGLFYFGMNEIPFFWYFGFTEFPGTTAH